MSLPASTQLALSALLAADPIALEKLELCLRERGWILLQLDNAQLNTQVTTLFSEARHLFASSAQPQSYRNFGFLRNAARKSAALRVLTGRFCRALPLPASIKAHVAQICSELDEIMYSVVASTCQAVFGRSVSELSPMKKIPLLNLVDSRNRCGMFDIVSYQHLGDDSTVSEHADPGLFALSLKSSSPGLQLFDNSTESWVSIDPDQAVLWCGSSAVEASNSVIKAAFHRVMMPAGAEASAQPRLTAWYEICALDQIPSSMWEQSSFPAQETVLAPTQSPEITVYLKTLTGKQTPIRIHADATVLDYKEKVQDKEGIPPSKLRLVFAVVKPKLPETKGSLLVLEDEKLLSDYGIGDESVVYSVLSLRV